MSVKRVFVEKKPEFAVQARELCDEIESYLGIAGVTGVRVSVPLLYSYSLEDADPGRLWVPSFPSSPVDEVYEGDFARRKQGDAVFSVEYLPGPVRPESRLCRAVREAVKRDTRSR